MWRNAGGNTERGGGDSLHSDLEQRAHGGGVSVLQRNKRMALQPELFSTQSNLQVILQIAIKMY